MDNNQAVILVSKSQGERGEVGYKKKYIISVEGRKVISAWGKAENWVGSYQTKVRYFADELDAREFATKTMYQKLDKGYELVTTR
jgi:predicted DNA-binding WGR domain protein